ncbi:hypothetical protein SEA_PUPPERS_25 [Gordonia phage Puppers]|nr:hypothetical protein SEA_PUPPERS_25 [Gordonia phage Puppers]
MTSPDGAGIPEEEGVGDWGGGDVGPLAILGRFGQYLIMQPLDRLLSGLLGTPAGSFDTVEELVQDLVPAIIRKVLGDLGTLLGGGSSSAGGDVDGDILSKIPVIGDVAKALQGITTGLSGVLASAAGMVGLRWLQVDNHETTLEDHGQQLMQLHEGLQASDVTSAWISLDTDDMVSFPRVLLGLGLDPSTSSGGAHTHSVSGTTGSGGASGGAHTHSFSDTSSSSGSHSHTVNNRLPTATPGKGSLALVPIPVNRGNSRPRRLKLITGGGSFWSSIFSIDNWYVGLYVLDTKGSTDRSLWTVDKVWDGGDRKGEITTAAKEHAFDMGTGLGQLSPGQILFGAQLQNAGALVSTRAIAAIWQPGISQAGTTLLPGSFFRLSGQSSLPTSISFNSLTVDNDTLPWMAVGTEAV